MEFGCITYKFDLVEEHFIIVLNKEQIVQPDFTVEISEKDYGNHEIKAPERKVTLHSLFFFFYQLTNTFIYNSNEKYSLAKKFYSWSLLNHSNLLLTPLRSSHFQNYSYNVYILYPHLSN